MTITEATPTMTPSIVRKERILLATSPASAMRNASTMLIPERRGRSAVRGSSRPPSASLLTLIPTRLLHALSGSDAWDKGTPAGLQFSPQRPNCHFVAAPPGRVSREGDGKSNGRKWRWERPRERLFAARSNARRPTPAAASRGLPPEVPKW
jgi:hypothetical protein